MPKLFCDGKGVGEKKDGVNVGSPLSRVRKEDLGDASGDRAHAKEGAAGFGGSEGWEENAAFSGGPIFLLDDACKLERSE